MILNHHDMDHFIIGIIGLRLPTLAGDCWLLPYRDYQSCPDTVHSWDVGNSPIDQMDSQLGR